MQLFNGKLYIEPSSGVRIVTNVAPTPNLLSTGVVGVIGTSDAGLTYEDGTVYEATSPAQLAQILRGGTSKRCIDLIFNPSAQYPGAQKVFYCRAQKATIAEATITQATGGNVTFKLKTKDKGAYLSDATNGLMWKLTAGVIDTTKEILSLQFQGNSIWTSPEVATYKDLIDAISADQKISPVLEGVVTSGADTTAIDASVRTSVFAVFTGGTSPSMTGTDVDGALALFTNLNVNVLFLADETNTNHAKVISFCTNKAELPVQTFLGGAVNETKAQVKARALAFNSDIAHLCYPDVIIDKVDDYGTEKVSPMYFAAMCAGLRAGLPAWEPLTWKTVNVKGFVQNEGEFDKDAREDMIKSGILFGRNIPGVGLGINKGVNSLQTNSSMIFKKADGTATSPENSIVSIMHLLNRELTVNSAALFVGGTAATVSKQDVINFTINYLKTRTSSTTQPNALISFSNVDADLIDDAWFVFWSCTPNTPINHVFHTGTMLRP